MRAFALICAAAAVTLLVPVAGLVLSFALITWIGCTWGRA